MKIVCKHTDRRSSGSIPINQCHVPINPISLGRGEMLLHNTEILHFPSQPEGRRSKESARYLKSASFLCREASGKISWKLSLNNIISGINSLVIFRARIS